MADTITLNGDYGLTQYRYNGGTANFIDASDATWIVANTGTNTNLYPFLVDNANTDIDIFGATINGTVPLTGEWLKLYTNSAAFMVRDTEQADIFDLRISQAWDAIRIAGDSDGFEVSNVWVSDVRDDAFENDNPVSGVIRDSLFDGVFSGISLGHKNMSDATNEVLEVDGLLMRMESYLFKGNVTHQSPFKMESKSPKLKISDTVIAIDDVNHIGQQRLQMAWDKTIESTGNVFLNLSDAPLPADYPMPPSGWTVLQGEAARDYWDAARADWIADHEGTVETAPVTPVADEPADVILVEEPVDVTPVVRTDTEVTTTSEIAAVDDLPGFTVAEGFELSIGVTQVGAQKFELDGTIFTSLKEGTLLKENFETAARADDKDDFIMYKWKTGELFYDADGRGAIGQIKIGQLDAQMRLDHTDFVVSGTAAPLTVEIAKSPDKELVRLDIIPTGGNHETILGFDPDADQFVLDSSVFKALRGNQGEELAATHFEVAARADDIDDFIMYKWKTGELFYDPDGRGRESQIKIAQLDDRMSLDHSDFLIV